VTAALVFGFLMQAGGVLLVVAAAFLHDRRPDRRNLSPLVWGGVLTTSAGTLLVLVSITLAAIVAAHSR
jgi:hypothetical protein